MGSIAFDSGAEAPGEVKAPNGLGRVKDSRAERAGSARYASALARDEPIGSGVPEAAVKQVITLRMKRPGASWTEAGGQAVLALRGARLSGVWRQAWAMHRDNERKDYATV